MQARYWDVGLLRSYRLSQIPNVALAAPMALLAMHALLRSTTSAKWGWHVKTCGLLSEPGGLKYGQKNIEYGQKSADPWTACLLHPVFLWQWVGMAAIALLFMHVHVITR